MNLTKVERAILIFQLETLKSVNADLASEYEERIEILKSGYSILYEEVVPWLFDEVSEADCEFVYDVLNMFALLEAFYAKNPGSPLATQLGAHFTGFDGNEEGRFWRFATFLIEDQGKWDYLRSAKGFALNSHSPRAPMYGRMLAASEYLNEAVDWDESDVAAILAAAPFPKD